MRPLACACRTVVLLVAFGMPAHADEQGDLDRIPAGAAETPVSKTDNGSPLQSTLYLQNDFSGFEQRSGLVVPLPENTPLSWEERLFFDARVEWRLAPAVSLVYSGRLNFRAADDLPFPDHENIRHDLRETYLSWQAGDGLYIELGRINLKSGVALGYNPTDFFKASAVVEPTSADPSVLREDRLGTVMLLGQGVWNGFAVTLALTPKLTSPRPIEPDSTLPSFDPLFGRTNGETRFLAKASVTLSDDITPEFLFYAADGETRFGLNFTRSFGKQLVGYIEWNGGERASLIHEAIVFGRDTGALPGAAFAVLPQNGAKAFRDELSLGLSWALEDQITLNLEYHLNEAGFSGNNWQTWFATGTGGDPFVRNVLWYIRGYVGDRQVPIARSGLFLRASWQDAFVRNLDLSGFVQADTRDASGLAQVSADYDLSRTWSIGALADVTFGGRHTDFGSLSSETTVLARVSWYL